MVMIRHSDTKPEVKLRKALWRLGLRYRLGSVLQGRPDLVFPRFGAVVFVDGCFWHACSRHMTWPKSNAEFWRKKIQSNKTRDRLVNKRLTGEGWFVLRVWEHEIDRDLEGCASRIGKLIREKQKADKKR
jgi:DNA mismatch endonuclease (patch repair protein)